MATAHERYRGSEMTTKEFVSVAEEVSGRELASFIGQWLERAGLPQVSAEGRV